MCVVGRSFVIAMARLGFAIVAPVSVSVAAQAATIIPAAAPNPATYADLADLSDSAPIVLRAQVRKLVPVDAARARGVRPGWARYYVEARTSALLSGNTALGEALRYLVDLPLDARGKPPALKSEPRLLERPHDA